MKIHAVTFYVLLALAVEKTASAKSFIFNKFSSGSSLDSKKNDDLGYGGTKSDLEKNGVDSSLTSHKRSVDDPNFRPFYKRTQRKRSPYGLVYNQGKPIGILEPISQSFEYSAYSNPKDSNYRNSLYKSQWFPLKRETDLDEERDETDQQTAGLHSNNYANVLAKFKEVKRETSRDQSQANQLDDVKKRGAFDIGDLSAPQSQTASKVKRSESTTRTNLDKIVEIEENLKDVMNDMGLVEKDKQANDPDLKKREIYYEDEDLENGLNKIGLTKDTHIDRNKKENCPGKTKARMKAGKRQKQEKNAHKKFKKKLEGEPEEEEEGDGSKRSVGHQHAEKKSTYSGGDVKTHIANYQSEGEAFIRSKRQEKDGEDADIMKGLEQSGDLTVSGNKSPLVSVTSADDLEAKKNQEKRDKEELEYEKRLERNIQAKIDAIKDEVKREIGKMKTDDEKVKDAQRKKREVANTLLDEETSVLDPGLNIDQKLEPYVRKRRNLEQETKRETDESPAALVEHQKETRDVINEVKSEETEKNQEKRDAQPEQMSLANITKRSENEEAVAQDDVMKNTDDVVKKNKRSQTEIDLSTGKTMIDLGDSNDALSDVEKEGEREERDAVVEDERQERSANFSESKDTKRSNLTDEAERTKRATQQSLDDSIIDDADYLSQRSAAAQKIEDNAEDAYADKRKYLGNPLCTNADVDRNARKIYGEQEANYGRLERNSKNNNLKILDEDSNIYRQARRRRDAFRKAHKRYGRYKRNDFLEEDPDLMGYRAESDGEIDDEGDEMDDDGFNDQTSNFLNKRQADVYDQESDNNYEDEINEDYPSYMDRNKRNSDDEEAYDNFLFYPNRHGRRKRQDFEQLVESHGGETALNHLDAVRDRNMRPIEKSYRRKRLEKLNQLHSQKQNIAELSDSDIFGGLPQSYEGELSRFKRVKRQT